MVCRNVRTDPVCELVSATSLTSSGEQLPISFYLIRAEYLHILEDSSWNQAKFESMYVHQFIKTYLGVDQD